MAAAEGLLHNGHGCVARLILLCPAGGLVEVDGVVPVYRSLPGQRKPVVGALLWPGSLPVPRTGPSLPRNGSGNGKRQLAGPRRSRATMPRLDLITEDFQCLLSQISLQLFKRSNEHLLH